MGLLKAISDPIHSQPNILSIFFSLHEITCKTGSYRTNYNSRRHRVYTRIIDWTKFYTAIDKKYLRLVIWILIWNFTKICFYPELIFKKCRCHFVLLMGFFHQPSSSCLFQYCWGRSVSVKPCVCVCVESCSVSGIMMRVTGELNFGSRAVRIS